MADRRRIDRRRVLGDIGRVGALSDEILRKAVAALDWRLLVPVDVQALYVPEGEAERFVELPFALAEGEMPAPFAKGAERPPGVHLRWALPDALLRGRLDPPAGEEGPEGLGLPPLPDRWVVLRMIAPAGSPTPALRGWVVESELGRVVPLDDWPDGAAGRPQAGPAVPSEQLTATIGGSPAWTAIYDAAIGRFALHDPLDDLDQIAPGGVAGDTASYLVAGWYADDGSDPLARAAAGEAGLFGLLDDLGWTAAEDFAGAGRPDPPLISLFHGEIYGVPVRGPVVADRRPDPDGVEVALGCHETDLVASLISRRLAGDDAEARRATERQVAAFVNGVGDGDDGVIDIEEREHVAGFASRPGGLGPLERLRPAAEAGPLPAGSVARSLAAAGDAVSAEAAAEPRVERRPAPRFHHPIEPQVAVRGAKRSLIQQGDGRFNADGKLVCRWPSQVRSELGGELDGARLIPALGNDAVPGEILLLAQSTLVHDPYLFDWLVAAAAGGLAETARRQLHDRLLAEAVLRPGVRATLDLGDGPGLAQRLGAVAGQLSEAPGVQGDEVGTTLWSQPWIPLLLEWEVEASLDAPLDPTALGPLDLEPGGPATGKSLTVGGRSMLGAGPARTLGAAVDAWLRAEEERDRAGLGELDEDAERALEGLGGAIENLDVVAAGLDSLHDRLLGLPVGPYGVLEPDDEQAGVKPVAAPRLTVAGELRLTRARLVDAFGRVLELPLDAVRVSVRAASTDDDGSLRVRPRLLRPARWMLRFVDPADRTADSREASIDQVEPAAMVNPVAGFLLPDHIDEAMEAFDTSGGALGELMHEPSGGGVVWEIAPGRDGPPDAPPDHGLAPAQRIVSEIAAGLVAADARARGGKPARSEADSALTALLRAVDTTLWSIDSFSAFGTEHVAGLVGRPIAVVRATLRLEVEDDLGRLDLSDAKARRAREDAYERLRGQRFPVRLGELTRADDGLLGFFVDDDYSRMRVVDRAVRDGALDGSGVRGPLGETPLVPEPRPIDHPYIEAEDELALRPGETARLTLLMHPMGRVHLTSGILPRKALQLARDWVGPGMASIAPSVRAGPVLIEAGDEVRLPPVSVLRGRQLWTRRDSPSTWRSDPIVAAMQARASLDPSALSARPPRLEEGYVRSEPETD